MNTREEAQNGKGALEALDRSLGPDYPRRQIHSVGAYPCRVLHRLRSSSPAEVILHRHNINGTCFTSQACYTLDT